MSHVMHPRPSNLQRAATTVALIVLQFCGAAFLVPWVAWLSVVLFLQDWLDVLAYVATLFYPIILIGLSTLSWSKRKNDQLLAALVLSSISPCLAAAFMLYIHDVW